MAVFLTVRYLIRVATYNLLRGWGHAHGVYFGVTGRSGPKHKLSGQLGRSDSQSLSKSRRIRSGDEYWASYGRAAVEMHGASRMSAAREQRRWSEREAFETLTKLIKFHKVKETNKIQQPGD